MLLTPAARSSVVEVLASHREVLAAGRLDARAERVGTGVCGEAVEIPQAEVIEGIMHIPIAGIIGKGLGSFEKGAGAVDVDDIEDELDEAEEDDEVRSVFLEIDSPGGMVAGIAELGDRIAGFKKPIYSFTAGAMCSAAYWIGASADLVLCTRSAELGAIGVYLALEDESARFAAAGVKVELFTTGAYKGIGVPGLAITREQGAFLQSRVEEIGEMFFRHLGRVRPDISREDMKGQSWLGEKAMGRGLADLVVRDRQAAVEELRGIDWQSGA
jgi:signal peptide peptidase SppA